MTTLMAYASASSASFPTCRHHHSVGLVNTVLDERGNILRTRVNEEGAKLGTSPTPTSIELHFMGGGKKD